MNTNLNVYECVKLQKESTFGLNQNKRLYTLIKNIEALIADPNIMWGGGSFSEPLGKIIYDGSELAYTEARKRYGSQ